MMKTILWLCNRPIEENADKRDGTWFTAMARGISEFSEIKLAVIAQSEVNTVAQCNFKNITQWVVPIEPLDRRGLPPQRTVEAIKRIVNDIKPDLIHIWGTENYWGLLTARGTLTWPALLEIQGLKYVYARTYFGGLTLAELMRCIGPVEIMRPSAALFFGKRRFEYWGKFEKEMIINNKNISTQSDWVRTHIKTLKPECFLFETGMMLRKEFFDAKPWTPPVMQKKEAPLIFMSSSGAVAYKGLHILMRAIAILKNKYPEIVLSVGGDIMKKGMRKNGYTRWLQSEAHRLAITDNIHWLGPLDASEIIQQYHKASAVVVPSFVETYSLAMAEAMTVGVPVVASYAGAMPELATNGDSALFFPVGDESACAWQLDRILNDQQLSIFLSRNARRIGISRNNPHNVLERQIKIYNSVLSNEHNLIDKGH